MYKIPSTLTSLIKKQLINQKLKKLRITINHSQNTFQLIYKIKKTLMESLITDFVQFSSTIARFIFLKERLGTRLCLHSNFKIY